MQNKTKRIAYISLMGGLPWGGSEAYWSTQASKDLEQGHQVLASVYNWGKDTHLKIKDLQKKGAELDLRERFSHDVSLPKKIKRYVQNRITSLNTNWDTLLNFKPDEVIINQGSNIDLVVHHFDLFEKLKHKKTPFSLICHSHAQYSFLPQENIYPRGQDVFSNAKAIFFVSQRQKQLTERMLCLNLKNAHIFQNPPNLKESRQIAYPKNHTHQMAIVGALVSGKGHDTLFEVLSENQWKSRNWQLNIYGKGYGLTYLQDLSNYFKIEDKVIFHGHVGSATDIWEHSHILLIPSDGEGLPISLVEAATSARTAVVTDVGGNTEIITDNETGFVACAPTPHSFSEALERAWNRKKEWKHMGLELCAKVNQKELL